MKNPKLTSTIISLIFIFISTLILSIVPLNTINYLTIVISIGILSWSISHLIFITKK